MVVTLSLKFLFRHRVREKEFLNSLEAELDLETQLDTGLSPGTYADLPSGLKVLTASCIKADIAIMNSRGLKVQP